MDLPIFLAQAEPSGTETRTMGVQNIIDGGGIEISITGMTVVFVSLVLITIAIALLPRVLKALKGILPAESAGHGHHHAPASPQKSQAAVVAAIGIALHRRRGGN